RAANNSNTWCDRVVREEGDLEASSEYQVIESSNKECAGVIKVPINEGILTESEGEIDEENNIELVLVGDKQPIITYQPTGNEKEEATGHMTSSPTDK
ncbi:hypothetical protein HAX54_018396, partial [Datura stramonium]|nr:hypothetical protein [Datura stramonium]